MRRREEWEEKKRRKTSGKWKWRNERKIERITEISPPLLKR